MAGLLIGLLCSAPAAGRPVEQDAQTSESSSAEYAAVGIAGPFEFPWSIAFLPDGAILVTEKPGRLNLIGPGLETRQIDGVPPVLSGLHAGLLDVAVAPDFSSSGTLYLSYASGTEAASTIRVVRARLDQAKTTLVDHQVIFESDPPTASLEQLGGRLAWTREGFLLLTLGDRWEPERAQDLTDHAGSIIRIGPDGSVPSDNPFMAVPGAKPEIWSYGHRNPQGLAVDSETGQVWSTEHGPQGGDEINLIEGGRNYGWPIVTYGMNYDGTPVGIGTAAPGFQQPIHYWVPSIAPSGLALERDDDQLTLWAGALAGQMVVQVESGGGRTWTERRFLVGEIGRIRDVRLGPDSLLYVITDDPEAMLYRLIPATEQARRQGGRRPL